MAPKKGASGKNKKTVEDSDEHWDKIAAAKSVTVIPIETLSNEEQEEEVSESRSTGKKGKKGFSTFSYEDLEQDDEEGEGGGLMDTIAKQSAAGGKKKKGKRGMVDQGEGEEVENVGLGKGGEEMGADDWMEAEFGGDKKKSGGGGGGAGGKKGKKGKKVQIDLEEDEELVPVSEVVQKVEQLKIGEEKEKAEELLEEEEPVEEGSRMLSKKEKEKIKKDKDKLKKKAQAAAKKQNASNAPEDDIPPPPTPVVAAVEAVPVEVAEEGDEAEETGTGKDKKKKKKKAAVKKEEPAPKKGGAGGQMAALRAMVEAQKAAAEETARLVREHQQRIEDEERRIEEEEALIEAEKARRREKEKAKREQQKKEGKLLTPKQKADKAAAEIRLKALIGDSGNTIVGLQAAANGDEPARKVSYASKKKNFKKPEAKVEEVVVPVVVEEVKMEVEAEGDVKDEWDASDVEEPKAEDVKDDWDASESEEDKPAPAPAAPVALKAPAVVAKPATNGTAPTKSAPKAAAKPVAKAPVKANVKAVPSKAAPGKPVGKGPPGKPVTKGGKAVVVESSSEEEDSDDESGSDDDSDDSGSDDDSEDDSSEDEQGMTATQRMFAQKKAAAKERRMKKEAEALAARSKDNMRSPICVILGHVDTGKTKLLDKIRQTNVQEGEAGGITQQIGATYFPMETIRSKTVVLGEADLKQYMLPGLLVIDTPGHESFTNLRTRGSSLCNIAILVVDIMHGLEPQTLESLRLLRDGKTPFIVALNKIDRLYGWKAIPDGGFQASLAAQHESVQREYKDRLEKTVLAFSEQGLNSLPYYENKDFGRIVSLVPTSAHTGEGVPDMLMLIVKLTQEKMTERLMYLSTLEATVLEVKVIEGLGTTIDVVLSNGVLHEGDRIVVCGLNGAIVTTIRALLTPQPLKELRIKGSYVHHKSVKASLGIKIVAPDLEKAIAGSRLLVLGEDDDEDELREDIMSDLTDLMNSVDKSGRGVCVQASTLGSLEALLEFLRTSKIPVSGINIGPVHRKDVMRSASMLEKAKELAVILAFDVPVDKEAEKLADELGIKIFKADIIYHLFDAFTAYNAAIVEQKRVDSAPKAVWPVKLKIIACFAKRDPIILGCDIIDGTLRVGTPLCVVRTDPETHKKDIISLGKITSLEINHKHMEVIKKSQAGGGVAVKIEHASYESAKQYGRHFDDTDEVIAMVSRVSIDTLKTHFRDDVSKEDWQLIVQLKAKLDVV